MFFTCFRTMCWGGHCSVSVSQVSILMICVCWLSPISFFVLSIIPGPIAFRKNALFYTVYAETIVIRFKLVFLYFFVLDFLAIRRLHILPYDFLRDSQPAYRTLLVATHFSRHFPRFWIKKKLRQFASTFRTIHFQFSLSVFRYFFSVFRAICRASFVFVILCPYFS